MSFSALASNNSATFSPLWHFRSFLRNAALWVRFPARGRDSRAGGDQDGAGPWGGTRASSCHLCLPRGLQVTPHGKVWLHSRAVEGSRWEKIEKRRQARRGRQQPLKSSLLLNFHANTKEQNQKGERPAVLPEPPSPPSSSNRLPLGAAGLVFELAAAF